VCCVLSGRGLCDDLIIRPEANVARRCVINKPRDTRRPWDAEPKKKRPIHYTGAYINIQYTCILDIYCPIWKLS
jgi:hypothetical protein